MGRFGNLKFAPGLKIYGCWNLKIGRGSFEKRIRPFKKSQKWVQMIPNTISDIFQPRIDFSYGLDVEIRPKLTPGAGTQVQYSTALWVHGHEGSLAHSPGTAQALPSAGLMSRRMLDQDKDQAG